MTSEIRTNSLKSRAGLSTVTFTDSGPMFSGITTFVDNSGFNIGTGSSIFSPATNTLTFGTNSNERLRIHSGGQVTVGTPTSNTSDRFTIVDPGNAFMSLRSDAEADGNSQIIDFAVGTANRSSSNLVSTITASIPTGAAASGTLKGYLAFSTNSGDNLSERLRIDSSGRVLIGTTSSAYKLCVADNTKAPLVSQLVNTNTGSSTKSIFQIQTGSNRYVNFENDYTGAYIHVVGSGIGTYFSSFDNHIFRNNAGTERLRITSGGKISYNYDGSAVSSIADVDIRSNSGVHIRGVDGNNNNANIYIGGAVANQRKTAIIHDPVGGYCRGDLHFCLENSADLSDVDVTDSKMVIKADGKIGIGLTNPAALTHIYDSTNTSTATEQFRISGGNRTADTFETGFRFFTQSPSANGNRHVVFTSNGNTGLVVQPYETSTGNPAPDRNISLCPDGGKVLIGTNSSTNASGNADNLVISQNGQAGITIVSTNSSYSNLFFSDGSSGSAPYVGYVQYNHMDNRLNLGVGGAGRAIIYDKAGSSGTNHPVFQLGGAFSNNHYNSWSNASITFGGGNDIENYFLGVRRENYGGDYTKLDLRWHTGIRIGAQSVYGGIRFFDNEDLNSVKFSIMGGGDHVEAHTTFRPGLNNTYNNGTSGRRWAQIWYYNANTTSDRNEKNTITESDLGLDFICKLKPVSYKWNQREGENADTKTHYGLISQDVEEAVIESGKTLDDFGSIFKPEGDDPMGLSYEEFISPLVKAIQEQQEQIKILQEKIETLEGESLKLKEENAALRERVTNLEGE